MRFLGLLLVGWLSVSHGIGNYSMPDVGISTQVGVTYYVSSSFTVWDPQPVPAGSETSAVFLKVDHEVYRNHLPWLKR